MQAHIAWSDYAHPTLPALPAAHTQVHIEEARVRFDMAIGKLPPLSEEQILEHLREFAEEVGGGLGSGVVAVSPWGVTRCWGITTLGATLVPCRQYQDVVPGAMMHTHSLPHLLLALPPVLA